MKRLHIPALATLLPVAPASAEGLKLLSFTTLVGEIITFAILVWVVMKYVWPPLMNAIETRQKEIADGLAAAEQGRQDLESAQVRKDDLLKEARTKASALMAEGEKRKSDIVDAARTEAESEKARILEEGRRTLEMERTAMCRELEQLLGGLAVAGATKIIGREVNEAAHQDIIQDLRKKLS